MAGFDPQTMADLFAAGLYSTGLRIVDVMPNLIAALLVVVVGYILAILISGLLQKVFDAMRLENVFKKFRVEDALGGINISQMLVKLFRWYLILWVLQFALGVLNLSELTWFINVVLMYVPVLIGISLFIIAAAVCGEWVREAILELGKFPMQKALAQSSKYAIIFVAVVVGLETAGFRMEFVREIVSILLQGLVYGLALAFGLAFGLGGQKEAGDIVRKFRKRLEI